ncbi:MAG: nitroreductase [Rhizobiaceae bacterium]|nr:nitroreductase [Rhizobiaceae bacterium]MCV0405710.1 nitroreductase [Rhizobiaceae bacterium]
MPDGERPAIEAILRRRSVAPRRLVAPGPDGNGIRLMVQAAVAAPDHGRLRPWRFVLIPDNRRNTLAEAFAAAARELDPDASAETVEREAEKARHGPVLLAVIVRIVADHPVAPASEQWASAGAAVQNMLLAAEDLGFRAMIVSGRKVTATALRKAFGLENDEHLLGFVAVGTPPAEPAPIARPEADERLSIWRASS